VTSAPLVVGANRLEDPHDPTIEALRSRLGLEDDVPIVPCQLIELDSVKALLLELLVRILEHLDVPELGVVADPAR
jgi:signal recognition particle receptor subunit beta